ncbi:Ppx/GppA family phosphatase [Streptomyces albus subsp. chlorinus]|uniref:Ppx/GppA phosphatase family protein n=1 Tax=Streptomyces albus TaxID=1888 RepID=UPI00156D567D|nr:Ppx/GppA phosphatase family protein [Streptomyces albus]NSC22130.1 Ppx/GppA family phosphatase [Streptomyces albus subsp. chlorinus]
MTVRRVAAIDCGTNSIRLLVADLDPQAGALTELDRRMEIVRLGQGVDRTGRLAPQALERTFAACRRYAEVVAAFGVPPERVRFAATSASRDADNREEFVRGVLGILGVEPEVITGDQEAEFSFTGATRELAPGTFAPPYLVVDIGGGSTEFVLGAEGVEAARSVDIGCVRLTERHLTGADGVPAASPAPEQVAAIRADVAEALDEVARTVPLERARTLVGLAGTVTTLGGIALDLDAYDSTRIHHTRLSLDRVRALTSRLIAATHEERAAIPVMHPGRVDVINAGALVLQTIMERTGAEEVVVSEHDILDGIAWSVACDPRRGRTDR